MTFNGLTDDQAEKARRKYGSNDSGLNYTLKNPGIKLKERFRQIPVKIYIIIILLYIFAELFTGVSAGELYASHIFITVLWGQAALFAGVFLNCIAELYYDNKAIKALLKQHDTKCHVYRCGNTVKDIDAGKLVQGDFVLLTEGDIISADGILLYGDITADSGKGSGIVCNYSNDESKAPKVSRGSCVTSGYGVMKVTHTENHLPEEKKQIDTHRLILIIGAAVFTIALALWQSINSADGSFILDLFGTAALAAPLILLASEGTELPSEFFFDANRGNMHKDGIYPERLSRRPDIIFMDKSDFITVGKPAATGFVDGEGKVFKKFYEIPYPLGTLLAKAVAENTSALVNRNRFIGNADECAELQYISERIENKLDLEVRAEDIKGIELPVKYNRLICGMPDEIIPKCSGYFTASGEVLPLSNTTALNAMAEEIVFQGNRLSAYAAVDKNGKTTFIGMIILHEKQRNNADKAYKAISASGTRIILLTEESYAGGISLKDKQLTEAVSSEIISMEKLSGMDSDELCRTLKTTKIITGQADKKLLISAAKEKNLQTGVTVSSYLNTEAAAEADVLYASASSCPAAKKSAAAVFSDGLMSLMKYLIYSRKIKSRAIVYKLWCTALTLISAAAVIFLADIAPAVTAAAILLTGAGLVLLCGIKRVSQKDGGE